MIQGLGFKRGRNLKEKWKESRRKKILVGLGWPRRLFTADKKV